MSTPQIRQEIENALGITIEKKESEKSYLERMGNVASDISDEDWDKLSDDVGEFLNTIIETIKGNKGLKPDDEKYKDFPALPSLVKSDGKKGKKVIAKKVEKKVVDKKAAEKVKPIVKDKAKKEVAKSKEKKVVKKEVKKVKDKNDIKNKGSSVKDLALELIAEKPDWSNEKIAATISKKLNSNTTAQNISWYKWKFKV